MPRSARARKRSRGSGSTAPPAAYGQAKRLVRDAAYRSFAEQLTVEARTIGAAFATPEAQALVAGFAAKASRAK